MVRMKIKIFCVTSPCCLWINIHVSEKPAVSSSTPELPSVLHLDCRQHIPSHVSSFMVSQSRKRLSKVTGKQLTFHLTFQRPLTTEAQVRSRDNLFSFCGKQSSTGTGFSPSTSFSPCQYHSITTQYAFMPLSLRVYKLDN